MRTVTLDHGHGHGHGHGHRNLACPTCARFSDPLFKRVCYLSPHLTVGREGHMLSKPASSPYICVRSILLLVLLAASTPARARPHADVESLLQAMTLDEKIGMLTPYPLTGSPDPQGLAGVGYMPGVPRLGIPTLRFSDGPAGVRTLLS